MDAQYFSFSTILSNYVWSILFYQDKDHNVSVKERHFSDNLIIDDVIVY